MARMGRRKYIEANRSEDCYVLYKMTLTLDTKAFDQAKILTTVRAFEVSCSD